MPSWLASARIDAHAVHHLVGDVLLGDNANNIVGTRPALSLHYDPHDRLAATEPGDHVEHRGRRSHDRIVSLREGAKRNVVRPRADRPSQRGVYPQHADDQVAAITTTWRMPLDFGAMRMKSSKLVASSIRRKSRSIASLALRTRNILACSAFGIGWPRRTSFMV